MTLREKALNLWANLAFYNGRSDAFVNDLLENIAGNKYMYDAKQGYREKSESPIDDTFINLTNSELRRFMRQATAYKVKHNIPDDEEIEVDDNRGISINDFEDAMQALQEV